MGRCSYCQRRREVHSVQRYGGGTYRRAGRWYSTSICAECAHYLYTNHADGHPTTSISRYGRLGLQRVAALHTP